MRGPVLLGGWSFGGIVAIQMAHLLAKEGRGLVCTGLLLVDTVYLSPTRSSGSGGNSNLRTIAPAMPADMALGTRDEILASLVRANVLCSSWRPPSWDLRVMPRTVLVKAMDCIPLSAPHGASDGGLCRLDALRDQGDLGWGELQPGLVCAVVHTPGHHYALFADENSASMLKVMVSTQDRGDSPKHWTRGPSPPSPTSDLCRDEGVSQELQPLIDDRPRRWAALIPVVIWIQWAIIACLSVSILVVWSQRRVLPADPKPTAAGLSPIEPMVPDGVTKAKEPLNYGYYVAETIPYDIFHNVSMLDRRLSDLEYANVATGVKANGQYGVYIDEAGQQRFLHPKLTGSNKTEAYLVSGLHHLHCMMETLRDYGLLLNGFRPLWNDHHVIHCFNKWYQSIKCEADSTGEGYREPFGSVREVNRASWGSSVPRCRDFGALVRWAQDPVRVLPFRYDSGLDVRALSRLSGECDVTKCRDEEGWKGLA
ncbi:uncharacterized protein LY79DRAFT_653648 [Colletotrichum navitas]|uniref:Thioesterase domain-containing protein n=1 Tax=Colletotrichum navitas TaxID=681940 RepID=A0AAD8PMT7_9PEZI|nr:uncharacterized protein LY79DRAFT_653648 [Colletotrichum navitas]KAK1570023.1 hypothetical protein LY79DRAFT_653648 [Colletotrichum navitas]